MRLLAIGDIHGCSRALDALLEAVDLQFGDTLVTLGDYVDRGPDSQGVLERLIALDARDDVALIPILGNHDQMMLEAYRGGGQDWLYGYGLPTLASYGGGPEELSAVPAEHWAFLERCVDYHETQRHLFVHANAYPDYPLADTPVYMLRWEKLRAETSRPHDSGKTLICGHTSQKDGHVLDLGHAVCIDTYAHGGGWLTCLDVNANRLWQANEAGEVQTGWLDEAR